MNSNLADRVTPYTDIIDSRDVIELIEQLENEIEALKEDRNEITKEKRFFAMYADRNRELGEEIAELEEQLEPLNALAEEAGGSPDFTFGETLIADSYFEEYAKELAEELGYLSKEVHWPHTAIDWGKAAEELKQDYFSLEFAGEIFWIRG